MNRFEEMAQAQAEALVQLIQTLGGIAAHHDDSDNPFPDGDSNFGHQDRGASKEAPRKVSAHTSISQSAVRAVGLTADGPATDLLAAAAALITHLEQERDICRPGGTDRALAEEHIANIVNAAEWGAGQFVK